MIQTDIFIEIGSQHKICEDYIIQGMTPEPFIILSDGCSSSDGTEMGARILCHLAKQYLRYRADDLYSLDYDKMGRWIIHNAEMTIRQLGLKVTCLDATLIIALKLDNLIHVFMYGDGMFATKSGDDIVYNVIDYSNNAPYYLSYLIDDYRNDLYHQMKNEKTLSTYNEIGEAEVANFAYDYPSEFSFKVGSDFDVLFIASDGLTSFIVENPNERRAIEPGEILTDFMAFKNTKGEFLKRRLNKAIKGLHNKGVNHFDDLSIGSFISVKEE